MAIKTLGGIEGNEIDVNLPAFEKFGETGGVVVAVIGALDEGPGDKDFAFGFFRVGAASLEEVGDGPALIDGNQGAALVIACSMQADGELIALSGFREFLNPGNVADSADGDARGGDANTARVTDDFETRHELFKIMEGFAHPHHDDVSEGLFPFAGEMGVEELNLRDHFSGGEVASEAHLSGGAEDAAHGTADLAADAGGGAAPVAHEDGLDFLAVGEAEEELAGLAIAAGNIPHDGGLDRLALVHPSLDGGDENAGNLVDRAVDFLGMEGLDSRVTKGVFETGKGEVVERVHRAEDV